MHLLWKHKPMTSPSKSMEIILHFYSCEKKIANVPTSKFVKATIDHSNCCLSSQKEFLEDGGLRIR